MFCEFLCLVMAYTQYYLIMHIYPTIDMMSEHKNVMVELFGELHYDSDEEILKSEEKVKKIIMRNQEPWMISEVLELDYSDIEEDTILEQPIAKISVATTNEDPIQRAKNLARYQRQAAARITKYRTENTIHLPSSIILTDSQGIPVRTKIEEIINHEDEIIRAAERAVGGKTIIEVMQHIRYTKDKRQQHHDNNIYEQQIVNTTSIPTDIYPIQTINANTLCNKPSLSRAEKRRAAKRTWFQNKRKKNNNND